MKIQVLGSGCPTCKKLYEMTKTAVVESKVSVEVEREKGSREKGSGTFFFYF